MCNVKMSIGTKANTIRLAANVCIAFDELVRSKLITIFFCSLSFSLSLSLSISECVVINGCNKMDTDASYIGASIAALLNTKKEEKKERID